MGDDKMAPSASPGSTTKGLGIRRLNRVPLYIVGTVAFLFLLMIGLVASDRANRQNAPLEPAKEKGGSSASFANELTNDRPDGIIPPAQSLVPPEAPDETVQIAKPDDGPPRPPNQGPAGEDAARIQQAKEQMFQEAVRAKTSVSAAAPRSGGSTASAAAPQTREEMQARIAEVQQRIAAQRDSDPSGAFMSQLAQAKANGPSTALPASVSNSAGSNRNNVNQFNNGSGAGDRWKLDSQPEAPRSAYELRAGFVLPATLISGINSELPGQIIGQVSQNVYDTPTGKYLLIPQGSRLIGAYSSEVAYGQSRVLVAWQRIVFPDGKAMDIGSMPGADSAGYGGFKDQVDNHYLRIFGSAILLSGITAGVTISQRQSQNTNENGVPTANSALSQALGQQLGTTMAQLISKNINIAPTLQIRPGFRFNVIVTKDLTFSKPYRSFDY